MLRRLLARWGDHAESVLVDSVHPRPAVRSPPSTRSASRWATTTTSSSHASDFEISWCVGDATSGVACSIDGQSRSSRQEVFAPARPGTRHQCGGVVGARPHRPFYLDPGLSRRAGTGLWVGEMIVWGARKPTRAPTRGRCCLHPDRVAGELSAESLRTGSVPRVSRRVDDRAATTDRRYDPATATWTRVADGFGAPRRSAPACRPGIGSCALEPPGDG